MPLPCCPQVPITFQGGPVSTPGQLPGCTRHSHGEVRHWRVTRAALGAPGQRDDSWHDRALQHQVQHRRAQLLLRHAHAVASVHHHWPEAREPRRPHPRVSCVLRRRGRGQLLAPRVRHDQRLPAGATRPPLNVGLAEQRDAELEPSGVRRPHAHPPVRGHLHVRRRAPQLRHQRRRAPLHRARPARRLEAGERDGRRHQ